MSTSYCCNRFVYWPVSYAGVPCIRRSDLQPNSALFELGIQWSIWPVHLAICQAGCCRCCHWWLLSLLILMLLHSCCHSWHCCHTVTADIAIVPSLLTLQIPSLLTSLSYRHCWHCCHTVTADRLSLRWPFCCCHWCKQALVPASVLKDPLQLAHWVSYINSPCDTISFSSW